MPGQLIQRGDKTWLIRVFVGRDPQTGKRQYHNETFYGGKKHAGDALLDALRNAKQGRLNPAAIKLTTGELLDALHRDYKVNAKSHEWVDGVVRKHLKPCLGQIPSVKLTFDLVQRYVERRQGEGATNATINREISLLRRAFNLGHHHLPPLPSKLKENNVRQGFFEHEDYTALMKKLPAELRPVLTFAYYTGCRRGEILSLQWSQVDLVEQVVRLEAGTTKNDQARMISLAPDLHEVLKAQKSIRDAKYPTCPWVFSREGEEILDFRGGWEEACKAAGLWNEQTKKPTKLFHDLRRTGVRNLVRAGVPEAVAMRISGHKTRSVFERYNIVSESDLKTAAQRLGQYIQKKSKVSEEKPEKVVPQAARAQ
jgi:integrase